MSFKLDDGTEPPDVERLNHGAHFYKTSLGQQVDVDVVEYRAGPVSTLTKTCTAGREAYGAECFMRVIAPRISEGYSVRSEDRGVGNEGVNADRFRGAAYDEKK